MTPRFLVLVACSLTVLSASGSGAAEFHVTTNGNSGGDGSVANPWDLQTALNQPGSVHPGDTIWVHGGTYQGAFTSKLTGTVAAPIIVRQAIGERATIDGGSTGTTASVLTTKGPYTWFWGLELMSSDPVRVSAQTGSNPTDILRPYCFYTLNNSNGVKMINLVCHDGSGGLGDWSSAPDAECYGNLIYNIGWDAPDRGHGHSIYAQSTQTGGKKLYDNIHFNSFDASIQIYGSSSVYLDNFDIEGNIGFNAGSLSETNMTKSGYKENYVYGGGNVAENGTVKDNISYFDPAQGVGEDQIGYGSGVDNMTATGNYFADYSASTIVFYGTNMTITGNTFFGNCSGFQSSFPNNTYLSARPSGTRIVIRPNSYEPGRANICIFNWDNNDSVSVDLSGVLNAGDTFELRDAQNFYGAPAVTGTFSGAAVSVPMTLTAIAQPIGNAPLAAVHTPKEFQVFVLLRTVLPVVTSPTTATGTVGMPFSYTITATNSPTSYSASPLPAGLSVNTNTGAITGTPTMAGTTSVTISATNAFATGLATLTITVVPSVSFAGSSSSGKETMANPAIAVSLNSASGSTATVDYAVTGGTAVSGTNYVLPAGTLTFAPGETTKDIPITILDDGVCRPDLSVEITLSNPTNAALGGTTVFTYTILDADLAIITRETRDMNGNGYIDAIRIVSNAPLNDNFAGLQIAVTGYTVTGYDTGSGANDNEFFVRLAEATTPDTDATPGVQVVAAGGLGLQGSGEPLPVDAAPVTPSDKAKPVLITATWFDGSGAGVDAGDPIYLTFSEAVTSNNALAADFGLPVANDTLGAGATVSNGQNTTDPKIVTIALQGDPLLTPGGVYSPGLLAAGSPTGVYVADGTRIVDAAGNSALVQTVAMSVDLQPGSEQVSICWDDLSIAPRDWSIGLSGPGAAFQAFSYFPPNGLVARNSGNVREKFAMGCSTAYPAGWAVATTAGQNQFELKAANSGPPYVSYPLDLATGPQVIATQLYSGHNQAFDLQFKSPTAGTVGAGVGQTITVTITAAKD